MSACVYACVHVCARVHACCVYQYMYAWVHECMNMCIHMRTLACTAFHALGYKEARMGASKGAGAG